MKNGHKPLQQLYIMKRRHYGVKMREIILFCKCSVCIVIMLVRIFRDLDLYPIVDQKKMKTIDANYNVKVLY